MRGKIISLSRGSIYIQVGDRVARLAGEMQSSAAREAGEPDYFIWKDEPHCWEPPFTDQSIDEATRAALIELARSELAKAGWNPAIK
jgi:hypothetical protein